MSAVKKLLTNYPFYAKIKMCIGGMHKKQKMKGRKPMKNSKKLLAILLSSVMILSVFCVSISAPYGLY